MVIYPEIGPCKKTILPQLCKPEYLGELKVENKIKQFHNSIGLIRYYTK